MIGSGPYKKMKKHRSTCILPTLPLYVHVPRKAPCELTVSRQPSENRDRTHPDLRLQNYENCVKRNVYCLSGPASDTLLQQRKLRQLCNRRKLEYIPV